MTKEQLTELTPMEMMKYKTRAMLNEILSAKDVQRETKSPWDNIAQGAVVKSALKIKEPEPVLEESSSESMGE